MSSLDPLPISINWTQRNGLRVHNQSFRNYAVSKFHAGPHCSEWYTGFIQGIHYPGNYPGKGIHPPHPLIIQGIYPDDYNYNNIRKQNKKFRSERNKFKKFQNKFNKFVSAPRNKFKNFRSKQNTFIPTYYITYLGYPGNYPGNLSREKLSRELSRELNCDYKFKTNALQNFRSKQKKIQKVSKQCRSAP